MSQHIRLSNLHVELPNVNKGKSEGMWSSGGCLCLSASHESVLCRHKSHLQGHSALCAVLWKKLPCSEQATYSWPLLLTTQPSTLIAPGPNYTAIDDSPLWGLSANKAFLVSRIGRDITETITDINYSILQGEKSYNAQLFFVTLSFQLFVVHLSVHAQLFKGIIRPKTKICHYLVTLMSFQTSLSCFLL